jgi:hypothetical protein
LIDHLTDADLVARIQAKLACGALPREGPLETFGGPSSGQPCSACDEKIATAEAELEASSADGQQRFFHPRCFHLLILERGPAASPN